VVADPSGGTHTLSALCFVWKDKAGSKQPFTKPSIPTAVRPQGIFCADVRNADIRIADHELWPMFGTHQLPDEFALLACDAPSGPPKHGRLKTIAVPRAAVGSPLGKAGLDSIIRACASRAGLQIPERPGISWGPLGGEGPPGKGAGLPSDAINCGSASSPYGEVSAPTAAGTVYKAVKAIYNVPKDLVN
jgi:hypothetical protein